MKIVAALLLLAAPPAFAADMFLKSKEVTVKGVADVKALGAAAARDAALKNAQRNAIEEVMGAYIESSFSAQQKESLKNNQSQFESQVQDRVYSKAQGFIESQKVVSEKTTGDVLEITLTAVVKGESLAAKLNKLQTLFAKVNYPKVMLVLGERYTDKAGKQTWIARPSITAHVENALLARGFELVAKDQADKLRAEGLDAFGALLADNGRVAKIAAEYGAEVVVAGSSEVTFSAFNEMNDNMYYVSAIVNLRAVNASTAKILASSETVGKSAGANEELARVKAVKDAAPRVVDSIIEGTVREWQKESEGGGKRYRVVLLKVKNYGKTGRPFIKAVGKIKNVAAVKELNFGGERLELEVIFNGSKEQLLDGIFDDVASAKQFSSLDKVMDRGDAIELSL